MPWTIARAADWLDWYDPQATHRRKNPGHDCVDIENGKIIYGDEESLADGPSDRVWKRSFRPDALGLAAWFERWLETQSSEEHFQEQMKAGMNAALTASLKYWRARTPEERAAFGLPEEGWEEALFGHLGIDLSKL